MWDPRNEPRAEGGRSPVGRVGRRRFLQTFGAGATAGIAGCTGYRADAPDYDRPQNEFDHDPLPYDETYPEGDVTTFRHGMRRLGYYPDVEVPDAVSINWQLPVNYNGWTAAKSSPRTTPAGDTILVPSDTGRVHAVSMKGEHRWTVQTGATSLGFHGTPTIVDDVAYLGGYDGDLYAFDVDSGDLEWRTRRSDLDDAIAIGSSPAYWDGVLYVVVEYNDPGAGTMWALDAETGDPLWKDDRLWGMPHPSTSIDPATERMVTGSNDGVCYCWEFPSLEFAWEFQTDGEIKGTIPTYDGGAFVGSWDNTFYRLSLDDGEEVWSFETDGIVMSNAGVDPEEGIVYVGSDDNRVYALDAGTGELHWSRSVNGRVIGSLTVTSDAVLVGSYDAHLYALEKDTGEIRWRVPCNGHVTSEPVPHDGRIYFAERPDVSGHWDDDRETVVEAPGHAYCLVPNE